jgi:hypothetical protein
LGEFFGCRSSFVNGLSEKRAAGHGIVAPGTGDVDPQVSGYVPYQINSIDEAGDAAGVQHSLCVGIHNLNGLRSSMAVPIESVIGSKSKLGLLYQTRAILHDPLPVSGALGSVVLVTQAPVSSF